MAATMLRLLLLLVVFCLSCMSSHTGWALSLRRNNRTDSGAGVLDCGEYGEVPHASVSKVVVNGVRGVHVECDEGYDLLDRPKTVLCNNGHWDNSPKPECAKRCQRPPFLRNAEVRVEGRQDEQETYRQGTQAVYKCADGLQLRPANSWLRKCVGGVWSGLQGVCVSNGCPPPPNITNGYHVLEKSGGGAASIMMTSSGGQGGGVGVEERAHYNCNLGYSIEGPATLQCIAQGYWNPRQPPKCLPNTPQPSSSAIAAQVTEEPPAAAAVVDVCPPASAAPHTEVSALDGPQTANNAGAGARLELTCSDGYRDEAAPCTPSTLYCQGGVWLGRLPKCVPAKECLPPPDIPHGSVSPAPSVGTGPQQQQQQRRLFYEIGAEVSYGCLQDYVLVGEPMLSCSVSGCWVPATLPSCHPDTQLYVSPRSLADYLSTSSILLVSLATALGVTLILLGVCVVVVCRHGRAPKATPPRGASSSPAAPGGLQDPDRVALIAFADAAAHLSGAGPDCSALPSYEEAVRERGGGGGGGGGVHRSSIHHHGGRSHWAGLGLVSTARSRQPIHVTRQSSSTSHSGGGDSMGSTDTVAASEVSTTVTLDTVSSHTCSSSSQGASCRAICGSLASFDTTSSSALNNEGVPLLEESELEDLGSSELSLCKHQQLA